MPRSAGSFTAGGGTKREVVLTQTHNTVATDFTIQSACRLRESLATSPLEKLKLSLVIRRSHFSPDRNSRDVTERVPAFTRFAKPTTD